MSAAAPFYLVWAEDGGEPRRKQPSLDIAQQEADRLARLNPGTRFFVMVPYSSAQRTDIARERFFMPDSLDDTVPF